MASFNSSQSVNKAKNNKLKSTSNNKELKQEFDASFNSSSIVPNSPSDEDAGNEDARMREMWGEKSTAVIPASVAEANNQPIRPEKASLTISTTCIYTLQVVKKSAQPLTITVEL